MIPGSGSSPTVHDSLQLCILLDDYTAKKDLPLKPGSQLGKSCKKAHQHSGPADNHRQGGNESRETNRIHKLRRRADRDVYRTVEKLPPVARADDVPRGRDRRRLDVALVQGPSVGAVAS